MDNFNLKKYLAEGKLNENQGDMYGRGPAYQALDSGIQYYIDEFIKDINADIEEGADKASVTEYLNDLIKAIAALRDSVTFPPDLAEGKLLKEQTVAIDLSWEGFQEKFPQVKDDNLAGEVYDIMQDQGSFDDMDDEDVIEFMNAASTWTDAEDVADYFDEPASDIGKLIAGYYQTESGYEDYDDKWYNYLDYLFPQTEREGDDIDDYYID